MTGNRHHVNVVANGKQDNSNILSVKLKHSILAIALILTALVLGPLNCRMCAIELEKMRDIVNTIVGVRKEIRGETKQNQVMKHFIDLESTKHGGGIRRLPRISGNSIILFNGTILSGWLHSISRIVDPLPESSVQTARIC